MEKNGRAFLQYEASPDSTPVSGYFNILSSYHHQRIHLPMQETRDTGSIPGSGRCPRGEPGNPLRYSYLENPIDKGARRATVYGVAQSQTGLCGLNLSAMRTENFALFPGGVPNANRVPIHMTGSYSVLWSEWMVSLMCFSPLPFPFLSPSPIILVAKSRTRLNNWTTTYIFYLSNISKILHFHCHLPDSNFCHLLPRPGISKWQPRGQMWAAIFVNTVSLGGRHMHSLTCCLWLLSCSKNRGE